MADSIIVGQFVGSSALAAVGACAALTNVFICVALGAGVGAGVLVSLFWNHRVRVSWLLCWIATKFFKLLCKSKAKNL